MLKNPASKVIGSIGKNILIGNIDESECDISKLGGGIIRINGIIPQDSEGSGLPIIGTETSMTETEFNVKTADVSASNPLLDESSLQKTGLRVDNLRVGDYLPASVTVNPEKIEIFSAINNSNMTVLHSEVALAGAGSTIPINCSRNTSLDVTINRRSTVPTVEDVLVKIDKEGIEVKNLVLDNPAALSEPKLTFNDINLYDFCINGFAQWKCFREINIPVLGDADQDINLFTCETECWSKWMGETRIAHRGSITDLYSLKDIGITGADTNLVQLFDFSIIVKKQLLAGEDPGIDQLPTIFPVSDPQVTVAQMGVENLSLSGEGIHCLPLIGQLNPPATTYPLFGITAEYQYSAANFDPASPTNLLLPVMYFQNEGFGKYLWRFRSGGRPSAADYDTITASPFYITLYPRGQMAFPDTAIRLPVS